MPPEPIITDTVSRPHHFHTRTSLIIMLSGAFLLLLAFFITRPLWTTTVSTHIAPLPTDERKVVEPPTGTVVFALAPQSDGEDDRVSGLYRFDLKTLEQKPFLPGDGMTAYLAAAHSPDGSRIALLSTDHSDGVVRLFVGDSEMSDLREVGVDETETVLRELRWSPDGSSVAFMARSGAEGNDSSVESWGVYLADAEEYTSEYVTDGVSPRFLPDGTLLVLKGDGVHVVPLDGAESRLIAPLSTSTVYSYSSFDVDREGNTLLLNEPDLSSVSVFEKTDTEWKFTKSIPTDLTSPVFSPDGTSFVGHEFDWVATPGQDGAYRREGSRLTLFSLRDDTRTVLLDLTTYYPQSIYITEWK